MPFKFTKPAAAAAAPTTPPAATEPASAPPAAAAPATGSVFGGKSKAAAPAQPAAPAAAKTKPSFMRGAAAKKEFDQADRRDTERRERAGSRFRFYIPHAPKADARDRTLERKVLFLDGNLDSDGLLDIPYFYEHRVPHDGSWANFRCTKAQEACPICEAGNEPSYCGVLSCLEIHKETARYTDRNGKVHNYATRLFVAKLQTIKKLNQKAVKYGGLAGCIFDVTRSGKRDASVGSDFEFCEKIDLTDQAFLKELEDQAHAQPADYETEPELTYMTARELAEAGIGKAVPVVGARAGKSIDDEM